MPLEVFPIDIISHRDHRRTDCDKICRLNPSILYTNLWEDEIILTILAQAVAMSQVRI